MTDYLRWFMAGLAIIGSVLVTSISPEFRLIAFSVWLVSNGYLLVDFARKKDYPVVTIYIIYEICNVIGVLSNYKVI